MHNWPSHFPEQCPPDQAVELFGQVFRFINHKSPTAYDFMSHFERNPNGIWPGKECQARGLSVLRTYEDCQSMQSGVPALRKKHIAMGDINITVGLIANTPSNNCIGHCTWWRNISAEDVLQYFAYFDEHGKAANV